MVRDAGSGLPASAGWGAEALLGGLTRDAQGETDEHPREAGFTSGGDLVVELAASPLDGLVGGCDAS
jgi:hypothetical protein